MTSLALLTVFTVLLTTLVSEVLSLGSRFARWIVKRAVRRLPVGDREVREEEWLAELEALESLHLLKVARACGFVIAAARIRVALREPGARPRRFVNYLATVVLPVSASTFIGKWADSVTLQILVLVLMSRATERGLSVLVARGRWVTSDWQSTPALVMRTRADGSAGALLVGVVCSGIVWAGGYGAWAAFADGRTVLGTVHLVLFVGAMLQPTRLLLRVIRLRRSMPPRATSG